ncbi:hypothetical protein [Klebsiella quasipneumoniae]
MGYGLASHPELVNLNRVRTPFNLLTVRHKRRPW